MFDLNVVHLSNANAFFAEAILKADPLRLNGLNIKFPRYLQEHHPPHGSKNWLIFALECFARDACLNYDQWQVLDGLKTVSSSDAQGLGVMARICQLQHKELFYWGVPYFSLLKNKSRRYWAESVFRNPNWYQSKQLLKIWADQNRGNEQLPVYLLALAFLKNEPYEVLKSLIEDISLYPMCLMHFPFFPDIFSTFYIRQTKMHQSEKTSIFSPNQEILCALSLVFSHVPSIIRDQNQSNFLSTQSLFEQLILDQSTFTPTEERNITRL